ncbi:IclR family transcriptional regulator C-terminal domain-containing protein [Halobacillus sp. Marseille-P3879]|uniref:IclR family transcriptional regulator domain-containing protein n=1 Tax=Halobacillus sp. Marseille-P3879 TaxID=2045014 RepID=UPI000C7E4D2F
MEEPLKPFTKQTITGPDQLRQGISLIRKEVFVKSEREFKDNIIAIGAPVYKTKQRVIASLNIAGLVNRIKPRGKFYDFTGIRLLRY